MNATAKITPGIAYPVIENVVRKFKKNGGKVFLGEVKIDEKTLQDIAMITKGKFFRATNNSSLKKIYDEIDLLEKSKIKVTEFSKKKEEFRLFLYVPFLLLIVSYVLENTILKRLL